MPIMNVLITLVVIGVILWIVNTYIPMDRKIKSLLNVVALIAVLIWLLRVFDIVNI